MKGQVVLFLPSFESGGVERNAVYFANGMIEKGFDVHLVYCRKTDDWFSRLDPRINKVVVPRWFRFPLVHERIVDAINMLLLCGFKIFKIRSKGQTAIVSFQSNVIAIALALLCRVPIAVRLSNHFEVVEYENSLLRKVAEFGKRYTYGFADVVIANSSELANDYGLMLGRKVETIHNPVDFEKVNLLKEKELDEALFNLKQRPIIVSAGRLAPQKNFPLLLRAMVNVVKEKPCDLVILGEGRERESLEQMIQDFGLTGFVHLLGYRDNVYKYFRCSDLFVLSSKYEGMPNVLIEAVACGVPAVATRCKTGPSEILCDSKGGELVPVDDCHALAEAIIHSLSEPTIAKEKQTIASENLNRYDIVKIEKNYFNMLNKILRVQSKR